MRKRNRKYVAKGLLLAGLTLSSSLGYSAITVFAKQGIDSVKEEKVAYADTVKEIDTDVTIIDQVEIERKKKEEEEAKKKAEELEKQKQQAEQQQQQSVTPQTTIGNPNWDGSPLTPSRGAIMGPSGKETYYNLDMSGVVSIMRGMGNNDPYWVREDGVKMLGNYVMVAANLSIRPRGSLVETSLGTGIVCDTGGFASGNPTQLDIAVSW